MADLVANGLTAYVTANSKEIATKSIADAPTAKLLISNGAVQTGVKGKAAILSMSQTIVFQDGASCGRTALGTTTLADKFIEVHPIKEIMNLCPKVLWNTYYSQFLATGQSPEEDFVPAFSAKIMDDRAANISYENEKLIWQGDSSLTGTTNLKYFDGFTTIITGNTVSVSGATTGSTEIIEQLQIFTQGVPVAIKSKPDFRVFMGEDTYAEYTIAMAKANIYKPTSDNTIFGTTVKMEVVTGLNTIGKVYGMRISNLVLGMDGTGDETAAIFRYSPDNDVFNLDFRFALGVQVIDDAEVYVATV